MKQQPQNQALGASETTRLFCTRISSATGAAGELCTGKRKEPGMAKRENEGKKEKKQKKEWKEKRKQYRGLYLNPISVPRARTRACKGRRLACTCTFREAGEAAMEIIDNCFGSLERDFRIWAWYCRHFDRRRIVDRAYFYASCQKCGEIRSAITAFQSWLQKDFDAKGGVA